MHKKSLPHRIIITIIFILVGWWLLSVGYYLAYSKANNDIINFASSEVKLLNHFIQELENKNHIKVIEASKQMISFKELVIKTMRQESKDLTILTIAFSPKIIFSQIYDDFLAGETATSSRPAMPPVKP